MDLQERVAPFQIFQGANLLDSASLATLWETRPTAVAHPIQVDDAAYEKQYRMNLVSLVEADQPTPIASRLSPGWSELLADLMGRTFTEWLERQTRQTLVGLPRCVGVYVHRRGDFLSVHRDKQTKALTAILYLNDDWHASHGGVFQMFADGKPEVPPVAEVVPTGGSLLAFKPTPASWHAVSPIARADERERLTVQVEYWLSTELRGSAYKASART
jgi:2OG-Fe(II) oxygenase superfamily